MPHPNFNIYLHNGAKVTSEGRIGNGLVLAGREEYVTFGDQSQVCMGNLQHCPKGLTISMHLKPQSLEHKATILSAAPYHIYTDNGKVGVVRFFYFYFFFINVFFFFNFMNVFLVCIFPSSLLFFFFRLLFSFLLSFSFFLSSKNNNINSTNPTIILLPQHPQHPQKPQQPQKLQFLQSSPLQTPTTVGGRIHQRYPRVEGKCQRFKASPVAAGRLLLGSHQRP